MEQPLALHCQLQSNIFQFNPISALVLFTLFIKVNDVEKLY